MAAAAAEAGFSQDFLVQVWDRHLLKSDVVSQFTFLNSILNAQTAMASAVLTVEVERKIHAPKMLGRLLLFFHSCSDGVNNKRHRDQR